MSTWEERLRNLATGTDWDLPHLEQTKASLDQLQAILKNVAGDTGLTGATGLEAGLTLDQARADTQALIDYLAEDLPKAVSAANAVKADAEAAVAQLGAGSLTPEQTAMIRGAEVGATIAVGPIAILVGEGAIAAANAFFGDRREKEAKAAVEQISGKLDDLGKDIPVPPDGYFEVPGSSDPGGQGGGTPGSGGGNPGVPPRSFPQYPDHDGPVGGGMQGYAVIDEHGAVIDNGTPTEIHVPRDPGPPVVIPTPDGPLLGSGGFGSGGGGTGGGLLGPGSGSGSLGSGLIAGAGGAAALGGLGRLSGAGMPAALARLVGLGGGTGGVSGIGGTGAAGGVRGAGGLTANSGGGLLGARAAGAAGAGGVGTGGAAEGGAGRGTTGVAGGAAGPGAGAGRDGRRSRNGRGLGGPIAPRLEDDETLGPLSENAGAGGRD